MTFMVNDELLEALRFKGEGPDLDFKEAQYAFLGATDHQKSELLKDLLAIANAYREGPGFILIGFKDGHAHPAQVVGLTEVDHLDDASLQQFVQSKVEPKLEFQYVERLFEGKLVALFVIPRQARPFFLTRDFGKLKRHAVYLRRGSSTDEASPAEVSRMGIVDGRSYALPRVELLIHDESHRPLANTAECEFLVFDRLPDFHRDAGPFGVALPANRDFWREAGAYFAARHRKILFCLVATNRSGFALSHVKLEVRCESLSDAGIDLSRADDLPGRPGTELGMVTTFHSLADRLQERTRVDKRGETPEAHVRLDTLRPGESGRMEGELALLPEGPGEFVLKIRLLASEISSPVLLEHPLTVTGVPRRLSFDDLRQMLAEAEDEEAEDT